jgi:hypothetical protein
MSLVTFGGVPFFPVAHASLQGTARSVNLSSVTVDATNEAAIMIGHIWTEDGSSHTIDTSGSSSLGWRAGTTTFANAGTTLKVGLAAVDTTTGPPARASNTTDVINFDVVASFTGGGGGVTGTAWNESVPTSGTKTIANGDLVAFAVQMTARAGADSVLVQYGSQLQTANFPAVTAFTGGSYTAPGGLPTAVITFSDGKLGFFFGGYVQSINTTQTWNSASSPSEYGNVFQLPVPGRIYGVICGGVFTGDTDLVLYSDPLGTPVAQKTISVDLNTVETTGNGYGIFLFPSPFTFSASTDYAIVMKPTTATNVSLNYKTFNASSHQKSETLGTAAYAVNRTSGAFAVQNSNLDRYLIGVLLGAFDTGASIDVSCVMATIADCKVMIRS